MNLDKKTIDLLWQIKGYDLNAGVTPNITDIIDSDSSLMLERRVIQLDQGEIFLLKVRDHGKLVISEAFTNRERWNEVSRKYLDKAERLISEEEKRRYEEGLQKMGRGVQENFVKITPIGTIGPVAVIDGKICDDWRRRNANEVYVEAPCGEPWVVSRRFIEGRVQDIQQSLKRDHKTNDMIMSKLLQDLDCMRCQKRHRIEFEVRVLEKKKSQKGAEMMERLRKIKEKERKSFDLGIKALRLQEISHTHPSEDARGATEGLENAMAFGHIFCRATEILSVHRHPEIASRGSWLGGSSARPSPCGNQAECVSEDRRREAGYKQRKAQGGAIFPQSEVVTHGHHHVPQIEPVATVSSLGVKSPLPCPCGVPRDAGEERKEVGSGDVSSFLASPSLGDDMA